jgi:hypothetical protein
VADTINGPYHKNAIKGSAYMVPPIFFISGVSLGYERFITKHSTFEISSFYFIFFDEMGLLYHNIGIFPAYKYFTVSENKGLNNIWFSGYLSILYQTHTHNNNFRHSLYYYGIGVSIGKKFNLSQDKKWFLDIGFGFSQNIYDDKPLFSNNDWVNQRLPRPILQIGKKF